MKKAFLLVSFLWCTAFPFFLVGFSQHIASQNLAIVDDLHYENRVGDYIRIASDVMSQRFQKNAHHIAHQAYSGLSTLLQVYAGRYYLSPEMQQEAEDTLKKLSLVFPLKSYESTLIPIEDVSVVGNGCVSIDDFFSYALCGAKAPLTQTESYLLRPEMRSIVAHSSAVELIRERRGNSGYYNTLLMSALEKERKHKDYYVLYHGQDSSLIIFYDLIRELMTQLSQEKKRKGFYYLRIPGSEHDIALVDVLRMGFETDHERAVRNILLPVNFSLFGNIQDTGECTFEYFLRAMSHGIPRKLIESLLAQLDINPIFESEIRDLQQYVNTPEGSLLQIFIPQDKLNEFLFLAQPYGIPLTKSDIDYDAIDIVDNKGNAHKLNPKMFLADSYLRLYRLNSYALPPSVMDQLQGRLLLTNDFLLNPASGVKIYRYTMMRPELSRTYKRKVKDMVKRMIEEKNNRSVTDPFVEPELIQAIKQSNSGLLDEIDLDWQNLDLSMKDRWGRPLKELVQLITNSSTRLALNVSVALHELKQGKHLEAWQVADILKLYGAASPEALDSVGDFLKMGSLIDTALLAEAVEHGYEGIVRMLIDAGMDVREKNQKNAHILIRAIQIGNSDLVEFLLNNGIDSNDKNYSPLISAVVNRNFRMVELLVEHGADVDASDDGGNTPLTSQTIGLDMDIMKYLIQHHADINKPNSRGDTPLHSAVKRISLDAVALLIEQGADLFIKNNDGLTALDLAEKHDPEDMARLLRKEMAKIVKKRR